MLGIGIIGAGRMGLAHSERLAKNKDAELAAVYDINPEKIAAYLKLYPKAKVCNSAKELVNDPAVGLIVITSPTYCHREGLDAAMATGKPIFCEKPLCRTREDFDYLAPRIRFYKNLFAIGFVRRYSSGFIQMKKLIDEGRIGKLTCVEINCTMGCYKREWGDWFADYDKCGGVMLDMLAHHCDLANTILGKPKSVYAQALMLQKGTEKPYDFVSATAKFKNGCISNLVCSWLRSGPGNTYITVHGEKGSLRLSDAEGLMLYESGKAGEKIPLDDTIVGKLQEVIAGGMFAVEMAVVVDCVLKNQKPYAGAEDAIAAMEFCLGMMESAETGKPVMFE